LVPELVSPWCHCLGPGHSDLNLAPIQCGKWTRVRGISAEAPRFGAVH
jgi:hypothetical protein